MRPISGTSAGGQSIRTSLVSRWPAACRPPPPLLWKWITFFLIDKMRWRKMCVTVLCCVALCGFFPLFLFLFAWPPPAKWVTALRLWKKGKKLPPQADSGRNNGANPTPATQPSAGWSVGWTRSPHPTSPHAQIPSPPPNKVHRVQPGRRRHIKERFSGSIGSDYFQWVCCFRCVDSTNQTMVRIRSRVQSPPPQTRLTVVSSSSGNNISTFQRKKAQTSGFLFHSVVICSAQVQFISPPHFFFPSDSLCVDVHFTGSCNSVISGKFWQAVNNELIKLFISRRIDSYIFVCMYTYTVYMFICIYIYTKAIWKWT